MNKLKHHTYESITSWNAHHMLWPKKGLPPNCLADFQSIEASILENKECLFTMSTYFFHWQKKNTFLDEKVIASNDIELEKLLWYMVDLLNLFKKISTSDNVVQKVSQVKKILLIFDYIKSSRWIQKQDLDDLQYNLTVDWKTLVKERKFKVPWFILPPCNNCLHLYAKAVLLTCHLSSSVTSASITKLDYMDKTLSIIFLLRQASDYEIKKKDCYKAPSYQMDYKAALDIECKQRTIIFYILLARDEVSFPVAAFRKNCLDQAWELNKSLNEKWLSAEKWQQFKTLIATEDKFARIVGYAGYSDSSLNAETYLETELSKPTVKYFASEEYMTILQTA
jgi:hypothetical protein